MAEARLIGASRPAYDRAMQGAGAGGVAVAAPTALGKLTLLRQIGEGGMARIFLARARGIRGFEKLVVVKQILPRLAEDAEFIARFFQEAKLAATLDHPNIATVYDVDQEGDAYFYSMEYVRGRDLHKVMRRAQQAGRALSLDEIVAIVSGLCAGLHHAHTRRDQNGRPLGIVHRDVSPSNVLLSFEGAVKLADFGVAKARTGMVSTDVGTLRGKLGYMSPEQCRGEAIDRRSDVYAVGVLLWEMLTGRRLHQGDSEVAIIHRIAQEHAPSPRPFRADVSDELERIVARALARGPAQRYSSAHALQIELEEHARQLKLATSARTIVALMQELFGEEEAREPLVPSPATGTTHVWGHAEPSHDDSKTGPTETVGPVALPVEASAEVPARPGGAERRAPWVGVAVGLGLGVLIGGGGLYMLASGPEEPKAAAGTRELGEPRDEGTEAVSTPDALEPDAPADPVESRGPADAAAPADPSAAADERPSSEPASPAEPETSTPAPETSEGRPSSSKRRKSRRRRASSTRPREINLDSPLPPSSHG